MERLSYNAAIQLYSFIRDALWSNSLEREDKCLNFL